MVSGELAEVAKRFGTPRRTVLLEGGRRRPAAAAVPLEVADDPCLVLLSSAPGWSPGRPFRRVTDAERALAARAAEAQRAAHDVIVGAVPCHRTRHRRGW